ncbi:Oxysterol-binding protein 2 [Fukomys damarensis]|uniref:Oxysterol-binding protein 2 n=1 Tax=Fukomys damarensis TaxID=885580 RepID=A0A091CZH4_FUKDA|nr:Oxysterol-binding protein 2 [Fukomys damarensis]
MAHTCRGTINLATVQIGMEDSCGILLISGARNYHLKGSSEVDRQQWITALELAKAKAVRMMNTHSEWWLLSLHPSFRFLSYRFQYSLEQGSFLDHFWPSQLPPGAGAGKRTGEQAAAVWPGNYVEFWQETRVTGSESGRRKQVSSRICAPTAALGPLAEIRDSASRSLLIG